MHMRNVDYSKPFADLDVISKIMELAFLGNYNFESLVTNSAKLLSISHDKVLNTTLLLLSASLIVEDVRGVCNAKSINKKKLLETLIEKLNSDGVLKKISQSVYVDEKNTHWIDSLKLFPKYRGVLPLAHYLDIVEMDELANKYKLSKSAHDLFISYINENIFDEYDHGLTLQQLEESQKRQKIRGDKAEMFVLDIELRRLKSHPHSNAIKRISETNVDAGFDIQSFESFLSKKIDRFIEVKSFVGQPGFYWSTNEIKKAREKGSTYSLVIVNSEKIDDENYEPIEIRNPFVVFQMEKYINIDTSASFDIVATNFYITNKHIN